MTKEQSKRAAAAKNLKKRKVQGLDKEAPLFLIAKKVAEYFSAEESTIFVRSRKDEVLKRRYLFFTLARKLNRGKISFVKLGLYCQENFGYPKYGHSTIINAQKQGDNLYFSNEDYREAYDILSREIKEEVTNEGSELNRFYQVKDVLLGSINDCHSIEELSDACFEMMCLRSSPIIQPIIQENLN